MTPRRLSLPLLIGFTLWVALWAVAYTVTYPLINFLWLCNIAKALLLVGLWRESPSLISASALSVLLVQVAWSVDFLSRLTLGTHPIGGTEYMFDPTIPLPVRMISLDHMAIPILLLWLLSRLGFDRRAWLLQSAIAWLVLPASYLLSSPEQNVNWVWGPFGAAQGWMPPLLYLALCLLAYPLLLYLPTHALLAGLFPRPADGATRASPSPSPSWSPAATPRTFPRSGDGISRAPPGASP